MLRSFFAVALLALRALAQDPTEGETPSPTPTESPSPTATSASASSQTASISTVSSASGSSTGSVLSTTRTRTSSSSAFDPSAPPDVWLNVPELSVDRIELVVEKLSADINLNAKVAQLVSLNAGIQLSVEKINITIADVNVNLELQVRLGHLVDIVNRVFESLDLNPLLIEAINGVVDIVDDVIGVVDGLLGSITQGGTTLNFLIDNLGHIVQQVLGPDGAAPVSTIVGDYLTNMTFTGAEKVLGNGNTQKTYSYAPLNALVDIVLNKAGQVVSAVVQKKGGGGGGSSSATSSGSATATPTSSSTSTTSTSTSASSSAEPTASEEPEPEPTEEPAEEEARKRKRGAPHKARDAKPGPGGLGRGPKI